MWTEKLEDKPIKYDGGNCNEEIRAESESVLFLVWK